VRRSVVLGGVGLRVRGEARCGRELPPALQVWVSFSPSTSVRRASNRFLSAATEFVSNSWRFRVPTLSADDRRNRRSVTSRRTTSPVLDASSGTWSRVDSL
jgi:hypothetical protein